MKKDNILNGMKIVNLGYNLPGPLAAYRLEKLGASIVKVEPLQGDPLQVASPEFYKFLTKKQKIIRLDLKTKKDKMTLDHYLKRTHLLITSSKLESLTRLRLDIKSLRRRFPKLCVLNIVGYASPFHNRTGHDLTYQAQTGLIHTPLMPTTCLADIAGANEACLQSLMLLFARKKHGRGGHVQVSLHGSLELFTLPIRFGLTAANGPLGGTRADYNIYRAKNGWVAIALLEPHFQDQFKKQLRLSRLTRKVLKATMLKRTAVAWQNWAKKHNLPIAAVAVRS